MPLILSVPRVFRDCADTCRLACALGGFIRPRPATSATHADAGV